MSSYMSNKMNAQMTTQLSFSNHQVMSDEEKQYFIHLHSQLPKMEENQLNITGAKLTNLQNEQLRVTLFIRTTVKKPLTLKPSTIILIDKEQQIFAKIKVDFNHLGTLSPYTSTPWTIVYPKDSFIHQDVGRLSSWSVAFEQVAEHHLDLSGMKEDAISEFSKAKLNQIIQSEPLKPDELSIMGLSAKMSNEHLTVTLLIRNGTQKNVDIQQLPLKFYDASGDLSAQGTFKLDKLTVFANTSKPISLVFPPSGILKKNINLSKWSIRHHE